MSDEEYNKLMVKLDKDAARLRASVNRYLMEGIVRKVDREIMECDIPKPFLEAFNDN